MLENRYLSSLTRGQGVVSQIFITIFKTFGSSREYESDPNRTASSILSFRTLFFIFIFKENRANSPFRLCAIIRRNGPPRFNRNKRGSRNEKVRVAVCGSRSVPGRRVYFFHFFVSTRYHHYLSLMFLNVIFVS